jgi:hypothetical protein
MNHCGQQGRARILADKSAPELSTATSQPNTSFAQPATAGGAGVGPASWDGSVLASVMADSCDSAVACQFGSGQGNAPVSRRYTITAVEQTSATASVTYG